MNNFQILCYNTVTIKIIIATYTLEKKKNYEGSYYNNHSYIFSTNYNKLLLLFYTK